MPQAWKWKDMGDLGTMARDSSFLKFIDNLFIAN